MVTILEPRETTVPVESAPVPEALQPGPAETGKEARECATRCLSPESGISPSAPDPDRRPRCPQPEATRQTLAARLIDEKVILI